MAGRRQLPSHYEGRSVHAPGMMRHGPFPGLGSDGRHPRELLPPERLDTTLEIRMAEMERLAGENHRLAATQMALREDLAGAQQEIRSIKARIRSIETESDIQVRVLVDRIAKLEGDIRDGEGVKKELHQAHMEARSLVADRDELTAQIRQATEELERARADIKRLPVMENELDSLRQERHKLRSTFEYEKGLNMEKVEQLKALEQKLVGMAREAEKLRAEVSYAEKRAIAPPTYPYGGSYMQQDPMYPRPPPMHESGAIYGNNSYGRPYGQPVAGAAGEGVRPYGGGGGGSAASGGAPPVPNSGGASGWDGGPYHDLSPPPRR